tara:strand:- start:6 stop:278 length:273 start_codon:yes stop_codon:yes gene_type:complete
MAKGYFNGVLRDLTTEEENSISVTDTDIFNHALEKLRITRNELLVETDFYALSDVTMPPEMETYRQELRDITNGLTTVEEVNAVVFPTKP